MISFLLQEGVITIGTVSGIFTALLLNSVKNNLIDPIVEKIAPIDKIHTPQVSTPSKEPDNKNKSNGIFNAIGNQFGGSDKSELKTKIFMRDFITWLVIMFVLYLAWKYILHPIKNKNNLNVPSTNTQFIPLTTGMGKGVKKF